MIDRKKFDTINVVPFIDIMLVILVIVLTTASFIQMGVIKLDLPKATTETKKRELKRELNISIKKDGEIFFNRDKIDKNILEDILLEYDKNISINLYCDREAQFNKFIFLLDILKKNSYENLGIMTKK